MVFWGVNVGIDGSNWVARSCRYLATVAGTSAWLLSHVCGQIIWLDAQLVQLLPFDSQVGCRVETVFWNTRSPIALALRDACLV